MTDDQQLEEKELLRFLFSGPEILDRYVVCSGFQVEQQHSLAVELRVALPLLKDAFLACAVTIKQLQFGAGSDMDTSIAIDYISKAMAALRSLSVLSAQDAAVCHALGSALAFSVYSAVGVGVPDICRYCLGMTDSFAESGVPGAYSNPWESLLVFIETMDCLVHRQVPLRSIQRSTNVNVDRHLGLCLPLMPLYHDLCVISNSLLDTTDADALDGLQRQLDEIHAAVESWQPNSLEQLVKQFDSSDIVNLLAQAKVYRLGALLMVHRLRYPFGQEDMQAQSWSREVLMELRLAKQVTNRAMRFVTLPFIVAAVEVRDEDLRLRTLGQVVDCVDQFSPSMQQATRDFLSRIWNERDLKLTFHWFDSVYKPCPVLQSITTTCFND